MIMSNDLISRKAVIELIESKITDGCLQIGEDVLLIDANEILTDVTDIKASYDVDKVAEKIQKRIDDAERIIVKEPHDKLDEIANDTAEAFIAAYQDTIDIVKEEGGIIC